MRVYARDEVCGFRFTRAAWGELSNFRPLSTPIPAGPWTFATSEHLYQAAKFAARPDLQERIAVAPTAKEAKAIGGTGARASTPAGTGCGSTRCAGSCAANARPTGKRSTACSRRPGSGRSSRSRSATRSGPQRARPAVDGTPPAAARGRSAIPFERLDRPYPRRPPRRPIIPRFLHPEHSWAAPRPDAGATPRCPCALGSSGPVRAGRIPRRRRSPHAPRQRRDRARRPDPRRTRPRSARPARRLPCALRPGFSLAPGRPLRRLRRGGSHPRGQHRRGPAEACVAPDLRRGQTPGRRPPRGRGLARGPLPRLDRRPRPTRAELVTDDARALRERLETATGERISALEGIGAEAERPLAREKTGDRSRREMPDKGGTPEPKKAPESKRIEYDFEL